MKKTKMKTNQQYESVPLSPLPEPPPRLDAIRRRAHQIYLIRGGAPGRELDDWLEAERELKQMRLTE